MIDPVVRFHDTSKTYGDVVAVDAISLTVTPGQIYALLGLNGAGKTTLIRMLLGMVKPSSGTVDVMGTRLGDRQVWSRVGYLVESAVAYPELSVRQNLEVFRRLRRLCERTVVTDAIELFGLGEYADRPARTLSLGNLQRLGLAKALMHRPALVVLDEPVNGLDPAGVVEIRTLLAELAARHGMTVLLSSHLLGEVTRVATKIGVLHEGQLVDEFDTADLASRVHRHLEVVTGDNARAAAILRRAGGEVTERGPVLELGLAQAADNPAAVATALVRGGVPPTRLAVVEEDLESYFLRVVGRGSRAEVPNVR